MVHTPAMRAPGAAHPALPNSHRHNHHLQASMTCPPPPPRNTPHHVSHLCLLSRHVASDGARQPLSAARHVLHQLSHVLGAPPAEAANIACVCYAFYQVVRGHKRTSSPAQQHRWRPACIISEEGVGCLLMWETVAGPASQPLMTPTQRSAAPSTAQHAAPGARFDVPQQPTQLLKLGRLLRMVCLAAVPHLSTQLPRLLRLLCLLCTSRSGAAMLRLLGGGQLAQRGKDHLSGDGGRHSSVRTQASAASHSSVATSQNTSSSKQPQMSRGARGQTQRKCWKVSTQ